ncbi:MAG TPA: serine protease [Curvibacter sp.]|nr:serine protease [Curvibacter sp.]
MNTPFSVSLLALALLPLPALAMTAQEVYQAVASSVWGVATFDESNRAIGTGSAVVTGPGQLITNCHVLGKAKALVVRKENVTYGAKLLHADVQRDLCLLKVDNFSATQVEVAPLSQIKVGSKAYAIGNPRGFEQTISEGLVSGIRRNDKDEIEFIQTSAAISPGSSGGGLFDDQGRLIGVTTLGFLEKAQNLNFAVPGQWIAEVPARAAAALAARELARQPATRSSGVGGALRSFSGDQTILAGDWYSYQHTDLVTSSRKTVPYVVDKVDELSVSYNSGTKIENLDGQTTVLKKYELGLYEVFTPVSGWVTSNMKVGNSWEAQIIPRHSGYFDPATNPSANTSGTVKARVVEDTTIRTPVREFKVLRIEYESWLGPPAFRYRMSATGWWSMELKRFVLFESLFGTGRERVELVKIERMSTQ